ncbi:MAG: hypothetical protein D6796_17155 [Caldilineae bacterium]|nr:MAG: hypothetical protein D6796_17155 [Caldilineae bacterium]
MQKTKLTLRVDEPIVKAAKEYARHHNTSLSKLVSEYLRVLVREEGNLAQPPILQELTNILPAETSTQEYYTYLESKYGR